MQTQRDSTEQSVVSARSIQDRGLGLQGRAKGRVIEGVGGAEKQRSRASLDKRLEPGERMEGVNIGRGNFVDVGLNGGKHRAGQSEILRIARVPIVDFHSHPRAEGKKIAG